MDMQYIHRIGIIAAFRTARELYPSETEHQCAERVAAELFVDVEAVIESVNMCAEEALKA